MPMCFWKLCNCPTPPPTSPCNEHAGFYCSSYNGQTITSETQINDNITAELDAAIAEANNDFANVEVYRTQAERLQREAERDRQEAQRAVDNADSFSERRQAINDVEQAVERSKGRRDEFQRILDTSGSIVDKIVPALDRGFYRLQIPYSDANGYCACYTRKLNRLAGLATRITTEQARLNTLQTQTWPTAKNRTLAAMGALVFPAFAGLVYVIKYLLALAGLITLGTWVVIASAIALLIAMVVIAAAMIYLLIVARDVIQTRRRLLRLILLYYRVQQIPTCIRLALEDDGSGTGGEAEHPEEHPAHPEPQPSGDDAEWQEHIAEILARD